MNSSLLSAFTHTQKTTTKRTGFQKKIWKLKRNICSADKYLLGWGQSQRDIGGHKAARAVCAPLGKEKREEHYQSPTRWPPVGHWYAYFWPHRQRQTPWCWPEDAISSNGICAQTSAIMYIKADVRFWICQRTLELAGVPLTSCSFQRRQQVHTECMKWKSLETLR